MRNAALPSAILLLSLMLPAAHAADGAAAPSTPQENLPVAPGPSTVPPTLPNDVLSVEPDATSPEDAPREHLDLTSDPPYATVYINGAPVGTTPVRVDRAAYEDVAVLEVEWRLEGYESQRQTVHLDPADVDMEAHAILAAPPRNTLGIMLSTLNQTGIGIGLQYRRYLVHRIIAQGSVGLMPNTGPFFAAGAGWDIPVGGMRLPPMWGVDSHPIAFTPSLDVEVYLARQSGVLGAGGPSARALALYVSPVALRVNWFFVTGSIGWIFQGDDSGVATRLNVGAQYFF